MIIPRLDTIKVIEHHYRTGEEPVLAICSDRRNYICKYMRSSSAAYKLVCELIGSCMATNWNFETPGIAFVNIQTSHWPKELPHCENAYSLGSRQHDFVVDVNPSSLRDIACTKEALCQLMCIALFDFWVANEDRNANNANLQYDVSRQSFVSIDYGCILNTATFDYPLSQLTSTDTILYSDLFHGLSQDIDMGTINQIVMWLSGRYALSVAKCRDEIPFILSEMPQEWNVSRQIVVDKLQQLFEPDWLDGVWKNFVEQLMDNVNHG